MYEDELVLNLKFELSRGEHYRASASRYWSVSYSGARYWSKA